MENRFGWFSTVVAITVLLGSVSWFCISGLFDTIDKTNKSQETIQIIQDTLASVVDIETGTRGFLLTNDEADLEPYNAGVKSVEDNLTALTLSTADNPGQKTRIALLRPNIQATLDLAKDAVEAKKNGLDTGSLTTKNGSTRVSMNTVRSVLGEMRAIETQELKQEQTEAKDKYQNILLYSVVGILIYAALLAFIFPLLQRGKK